MSESYQWSNRPSTAVDVATCGDLAIDHEIARGLMRSVNHHLRTPLTVVLGHAELLIDREQELSSEVRESLECLLRAAQRLNEVVVGVCDLMDIACVSTHDLIVVDIHALVAEEVAAYQDRAAKRGVRLVLSADPTQVCIADPRRLRRAVRELLDNALTYAPDRSTVQVRSTTSAKRILIKVSDHGDGISPDDHERLARPFERGTHPRQAPAGLGMGLAVASAVAAWHGGRLVLSQRLDGGVEACIDLPHLFVASDRSGDRR